MIYYNWEILKRFRIFWNLVKLKKIDDASNHYFLNFTLDPFLIKHMGLSFGFNAIGFYPPGITLTLKDLVGY